MQNASLANYLSLTLGLTRKPFLNLKSNKIIRTRKTAFTIGLNDFLEDKVSLILANCLELLLSLGMSMANKSLKR